MQKCPKPVFQVSGPNSSNPSSFMFTFNYSPTGFTSSPEECPAPPNDLVKAQLEADMATHTFTVKNANTQAILAKGTIEGDFPAANSDQPEFTHIEFIKENGENLLHIPPVGYKKPTEEEEKNTMQKMQEVIEYFKNNPPRQDTPKDPNINQNITRVLTKIAHKPTVDFNSDNIAESPSFMVRTDQLGNHSMFADVYIDGNGYNPYMCKDLNDDGITDLTFRAPDDRPASKKIPNTLDNPIADEFANYRIFPTKQK